MDKNLGILVGDRFWSDEEIEELARRYTEREVENFERASKFAEDATTNNLLEALKEIAFGTPAYAANVEKIKSDLSAYAQPELSYYVERRPIDFTYHFVTRIHVPWSTVTDCVLNDKGSYEYITQRVPEQTMCVQIEIPEELIRRIRYGIR